MMMKDTFIKPAVFCLAYLLLFYSAVPAFGTESILRLQNQLGGDFDAEKNEMDAQWDALEKMQQAAWSLFKKNVEKKWRVFVSSTQKQWIDYDDTLDTRSRVDFENGWIEIESILPEGLTRKPDRAGEKILKQIRAIFSKEAQPGEAVLGSQVQYRNDRFVTPANLVDYFKKAVQPRIMADPEPFTSRDGQTRRRYAVKINLVPDHIDIRARRYVPQVRAYARRYHLDPKLIMAIIHTESFFNPLAVSKSGAIGLMQVIPRYAGREAYRYQYEKDWVIRPEYLYHPGINIEMGTTYLHLLQNSYFSEISGATKRRYLTICAYNWGPTAVMEKIVKKNRIATMSDQQLFALLKRKTPRETGEYLEKVTRRTKIYAAYF